jgi:tetrahydromethanopterin S-methyltransferase subunit A
MMSEQLQLYPWGGRFTEGNPAACIAVVTLSEEFQLPPGNVALFGSMKTENLGVEKVVANVISNPNIRFLIVCGTEVRGHRSGDSLICLHKLGLDGNNRVIGAKSAIPFIENLPQDAIERFRKQVELVNLIDVNDLPRVINAINVCVIKNPGPFAKAMFVPHMPKETVTKSFHSDLALHSKIDIDLYGVVAHSPEAD